MLWVVSSLLTTSDTAATMAADARRAWSPRAQRISADG
jgi:hypothetical protein